MPLSSEGVYILLGVCFGIFLFLCAISIAKAVVDRRKIKKRLKEKENGECNGNGKDGRNEQGTEQEHRPETGTTEGVPTPHEGAQKTSTPSPTTSQQPSTSSSATNNNTNNTHSKQPPQKQVSSPKTKLIQVQEQQGSGDTGKRKNNKQSSDAHEHEQ
ncbi:uncharacterized protein LOC142352143 [Convolutriloba macropyga]|uniref:uncharacterized protein LOC142352143 n=1 Tax=Convolutriloba macropyga TaxID=536237 RepID=UPI003F51CD6F